RRAGSLGPLDQLPPVDPATRQEGAEIAAGAPGTRPHHVRPGEVQAGVQDLGGDIEYVDTRAPGGDRLGAAPELVDRELEGVASREERGMEVQSEGGAPLVEERGVVLMLVVEAFDRRGRLR